MAGWERWSTAITAILSRNNHAVASDGPSSMAEGHGHMHPDDDITLLRPADVPRRFVQCWNQRDARQLAALFDEDAEFVNVVGLWWHRRHDIWKAHDYGLRVIFNSSTLEMGDVRVKHLSDAIAVVHARLRLSGQTALKGRPAAMRQTVLSLVVHRTEGGWRCASAQNTEIIPGQETFMVGEDGKAVAVNYRSVQMGEDGNSRE